MIFSFNLLSGKAGLNGAQQKSSQCQNIYSPNHFRPPKDSEQGSPDP